MTIFCHFKDIQPTFPPSVVETSIIASTVSNLLSPLSLLHPQINTIFLPVVSNKPDFPRLDDPPEQLNQQQSTTTPATAFSKQKENSNLVHGVKEICTTSKQSQKHHLDSKKSEN